MLGVFGLVLMFKSCEASAESLADYAKRLGFKPPLEVTKAISYAAKSYGLDEAKLLRIAVIESSLNPKAYGLNRNGTEDVGLFQINTVTYSHECIEFNVWSIKGNALCAAKVLSRHKKSGDPYYIGRYHSLTPSRKLDYYRKVRNISYGNK
jgi:hypothetical protein